ncbi:MAG TPA: (Fe-S)-binding protein [Burkholderiales bacterium]|nr:(Fe-S)-binding protein [Burkholderiales bacterium]
MNHSDCSGCSLCLLVCPAWRETRDVRLTPRGRAKARQHGASAAEIASWLDGCTLCGACEPICPESLPLVDMVMELRRERPGAEIAFRAAPVSLLSTHTVILPGRALGADEARGQRTLGLFGAGHALAEDDGNDLALALEAGRPIPPGRLSAFLEPLRAAKRLIVAEGLLLRALRRWLPKVPAISLGEALSVKPAIREKLRPSDLYVIAARPFHNDHARLVGHYDGLRNASGCEMNLDLQRIAIPAAQARWILEGRQVARIVVEDVSDAAAFSFSAAPVLHLADL